MLEDMILSLTPQLSGSYQDEGDRLQGESDGRGLGRSAERSAFTIRAVNMGRNLSLLFQHYEQLQDRVNSLIRQQTKGRAGPLDDTEEASQISIRRQVKVPGLKIDKLVFRLRG